MLVKKQKKRESNLVIRTEDQIKQDVHDVFAVMAGKEKKAFFGIRITYFSPRGGIGIRLQSEPPPQFLVGVKLEQKRENIARYDVFLKFFTDELLSLTSKHKWYTELTNNNVCKILFQEMGCGTLMVHGKCQREICVDFLSEGRVKLSQ